MKVMIVDDEPLLQERISKAISENKKDIKIIQALNYKEAVRLFVSEAPDTVVLDIALPDGSWIKLLRQFKQENPLVRIIMFTNYPTADFKQFCFSYGADFFLDKSSLKKLMEIIN